MSDLEKLLSVSFLTPMGNPTRVDCVWGAPLLIWGAPGVGKSARCVAAGRRVGLQVEPVYPATRQPEDFSGCPVPDGKGGLAIECILGAARTLIKEGIGVLFLDEISCARPSVQAALLSLVLDRRIGDTLLPPTIRIIAAANPPEEAAGGYTLEPPMANRFLHIDEPPPSAERWINWLTQEHEEEVIPIEQGQDTIAKLWPEVWPVMKGQMAGFMKKRPTLLHKMPENVNERGRAWPSPRTWEMAARTMATAKALSMPSDTVLALAGAAVGQGAAGEFGQWLTEADLPDPHDMLTRGWKIDERRLDRTIAALTAMASYVVNRPDKEEKEKFAVAGWNILAKVCDGPADLTIAPARVLIRGGCTRSMSPAVADAAKPVMLRYGRSSLADFVK